MECPVSRMSRRRRSVHIDGSSCNEPSPLLLPVAPRRQSLPARFRIFAHDLQTILFSAYINILLIFVPFAICSDPLGWSSTIVFTMNFLGLIPLALLMSYSTKEVSRSVGSTAG